MPYIIKIDINWDSSQLMYHKTTQGRVNVCIAKYIKTWLKQNLDTALAAVVGKNIRFSTRVTCTTKREASLPNQFKATHNYINAQLHKRLKPYIVKPKTSRGRADLEVT